MPTKPARDHAGMPVAQLRAMSVITPILAAVVAAVHFAVIFWPRKPPEGPTDENGFPLLWSNDNSERKDVTCTWTGGGQPPTSNHPAEN